MYEFREKDVLVEQARATGKPEAAIEKIKGIANSFNSDDMRKMAKANYSNMARTLQGYMV
jgi:hypothetical protein